MDAQERIIKYFAGELSQIERINLLKDSESDPDLREKILAVQNVRGIFALDSANIDRDEARRHYALLMRKIRNNAIRNAMFTVMKYAAVVVLTVGTTLWFATSIKHEQPTPLAVNQELYVPPGQRARITLPDSSIVWLNAGSTLHYPSVFGTDRRVDLTGEAYFEVAKDRTKPFIVAAGQLEVEAVGTEFNVQNYPKTECVSITLIEGAVNVCMADNKNNVRAMTPNQQLLCKNGNINIEDGFDKDLLLWKDGIYSFKQDNLEDIIAQLMLYYDVKIVVTNKNILRYTYTGKFRQRDGIMEILRIIRKIHHFTILHDEANNIITLS
ncbi:MAG: FecR domain-containing protein [Tannerella sp.]|jgi:ferric-dicitrate binding protein FerR (iron transport regulator)|nr:FecR domain-containing protein [Tannerella sp.]